MKRLMFLFVTLFLCPVVLGQSANSQSVDLSSIRSKIANNEAVLIDVREQSEWNQCHLKAATLIPLSALRNERQQAQCIANLEQNVPIYCHCKAGYRAKSAAQILEQLGFDATPITQAYDSIVDSGFEEDKQR